MLFKLKNMLFTTGSLLILICTNFIQSQENLLESKDYFIEKQIEYTEWLKNTGLPNIDVDSSVVTQQNVFLYLYTNQFNDLNDLVYQTSQVDLPEMLMNQMLFLFEVTHKQAILYFNQPDKRYSYSYSDLKERFVLYDEKNLLNDFFVDDTLSETEEDDSTETRTEVVLSRKTYPSYKMDSLNIKIQHSKIGSQHFESNYQEIREVKKLIAKGLDAYFKQYQTAFESYSFYPSTISENLYRIEVKNIHNLVLEGEDYFEYILIYFSIYKENNKIMIKYKLYSKYASGILWSPRLSAYHDVQRDYQPEFERFNDRLKGQINELLYK